MRLLKAVALVHHPEKRVRRKQSRDAARDRAQEKARRTEALLDRTGIRTLRRKPVFTTPNYFPPQPPGQHDAGNDAAGDVGRGESPEPQHCYVCKQKYSPIHHFYDQLCPACAELNFRKRTETGRPARPRRAADRRAGEDRLPGRPQAAARRRAPDRHHALPARLGRALRRRSRTSPSGATGWRSSASTCATRRAWRRSAANWLATRDRLDFIINNACQTVRRPPEFYAHMMAGETARRCTTLPEHVRKLLGATRACAATTCCPKATRRAGRSATRGARRRPG